MEVVGTKKIGYMCATSFFEELESDVMGMMEVYSSEEGLRKDRMCVNKEAGELTCGIVKVEFTVLEEVQKSDY